MFEFAIALVAVNHWFRIPKSRSRLTKNPSDFRAVLYLYFLIVFITDVELTFSMSELEIVLLSKRICSYLFLSKHDPNQ
jgi:hypothetical protein